MNWIAYLMGGVLLGTAAWLMVGKEQRSGARRRRDGQPPVADLAHQLQEAWADHHTQV